jgi:hydroxypyruvate reductase
MNNENPMGRERALLEALFQAAIAAAQPDKCVPAHLPPAPPAAGWS